MLESLKALEHEEKIYDVIQQINEYWDVLDKGMYAANSQQDFSGLNKQDEDRIEELRNQLTKLLETDYYGQVILDDVTQSHSLFTDEEKPLTSRRAERLGAMLRIRMLLAEMYEHIVLLKSYHILHQGLINYHYYAIGRPSAEKGILYNDKVFEIPDEYNDTFTSLHNPKAIFAQRRLKDIEITEEILLKIRQVVSKEKCDLPNAYLWLKAKVQLITILFCQARYDEVLVYCDSTKTECDELGDKFFTRILDQFIVLIKINKGYIEEGLKMYRDIEAYAETHKQTDVYYIQFLCNIGEILYHFEKLPQSIELFRRARVILKDYLYLIGLRLRDHHDADRDLNVNYKCAKFSEKAHLTAQEIKRMKQRTVLEKLAAGEEPDKANTYKNFEDVYDFENELFYELFALDKMGEGVKFRKCAYLQHLELLVKIELRYAYALATIEEKYDEALEILNETERIIKYCIYLNPYHLYLLHFTIGYCRKQKFYTSILSFQPQNPTISSPKSLNKGHKYSKTPNFRSQIKETLRPLLLSAKTSLSTALKFIPLLCPKGEFGIDTSD